MKPRLIISFLLFVLLITIPRSGFAIPIFYSLHGTAYLANSGLSEEISGTMVIDSVPDGPASATYKRFDWLVNSITISTNIFQFYGAGSLELMGPYNSDQIYDYNEPRITGYGITPYFMGTMGVADCANLFYHEDGTPYESTMSAYINEGLPYMISRASLWGFAPSYDGHMSPMDPNRVVIQNFCAIRETVNPVPEPATLLLLGVGLAGVLALYKKREVRN